MYNIFVWIPQKPVFALSWNIMYDKILTLESPP